MFYFYARIISKKQHKFVYTYQRYVCGRKAGAYILLTDHVTNEYNNNLVTAHRKFGQYQHLTNEMPKKDSN